ncbi:hypothetical protein [Brevundimonas sp. TWP2-3-4b1]|uniref:hypothetical protein n=1 Tax=Brevundimonas sp. TWP2-3-4b1 TaxID=2804580 RepID=UPI003CED669F
MTDDDEPQVTPEEAAAIAEDCARDEARRSLLADALALIACKEPDAVSVLRHQARRSRTGAELGLYKAEPGQDWVAFFTERAALLEHACGAAGYPHKSADVLSWRQPIQREPFMGPGQVLAFARR